MFYLSSPTHSCMFTSNVLALVYSKVIFNCGLTEIEPCFLVEHPSHNSMLSHRGPKFDCPRQCLNIFVIKRSVKLWWGWKFLITILDWLSPFSCDSDSWEKFRQVQRIILSTKGNCVLCCFVDLTYVDGSQPPARPECLLHSLKNVIASYILKIFLMRRVVFKESNNYISIGTYFNWTHCQVEQNSTYPDAGFPDCHSSEPAWPFV